MIICGLNKTTLLDYPGHVASTIFLGGCNFRCQFCQNSSLVLNPYSESSITKEDLFSHLSKRKGIISGICITGGEPTLNSDLPDLIRDIKALDFKVKLDTNGYNPTMLEYLIQENLLDMVSMDIKASKEVYPDITGIPNLDICIIDKSINILKNSNLHHEFRTTVVNEYFSENDIHAIGKWLPKDSLYYLQLFKTSGLVLKKGLHAPNTDTINTYLEIIRNYIPNSHLRGID